MPERSADWLAQAHRDLEVARHDLQGGFYEWACFVSEQAAEKALKGVFQSRNLEARGHSLTRLLEGLQLEEAPPAGVTRAATVLDRYYIQPRYPNGFDSGAPFEYYQQRDAAEAINYAETVLRFRDSLVPRPGEGS